VVCRYVCTRGLPGRENADVNRYRWAVAAGLAVAVAVGAAGFVGWQHLRPRLPTLASATAALDRAVVEVIQAAGDNAADTVSPLVPTTSCEKTFLAKGSRYTRTADLYTDPGAEGYVLGLIAAVLPAAVRGLPTPAGVAGLTADLGNGLRLQVLPVGAGWLAATAETDCRSGDPAPARTATVTTADSQPVTALLAELGTAPTGFHEDAVSCGRGQVTTLDTASQPTVTDNLAGRLGALIPASARRFRSSANRVVWRVGGVSTVVASSDDGTQITVQRTVTCPL
jgi:hypothetical protein